MMNRRTALLLTTAWTSLLLPARLIAQQAPRSRKSLDPIDDVPIEDDGGGFRRARPAGSGSASKTVNNDDLLGDSFSDTPSRGPRPIDDDLMEGDGAEDEPLDDRSPGSAVGAPADLPTEAGQVFRGFDISSYTGLPHEATNPQDAIVEWIFRRTGSGVWHGDRIAVLAAGRAQIRAYHTPKVLRQVEEIVERFIDAQPSDYLKIRVRIVAAANPGWRYYVGSRLTPIASGAQGQQVYLLDLETATFVRTQMQVYQSFKVLEDRELKIINGQTLNLNRELNVDYMVGPQRDSAAGLGFQPTTAKLKEGVFLRLSPLLTFEGDAVDLALDLQANTVKSLIPTKILARRELGPQDMSVDVPEVVESRLNRTIEGWKLGQTLMITGGIQPGILQEKTGLFNLKIPGTVPTKTELLVFLDVETVGGQSPRQTAQRDRERG
jgi:hypothetical protein